MGLWLLGKGWQAGHPPLRAGASKPLQLQLRDSECQVSQPKLLPEPPGATAPPAGSPRRSEMPGFSCCWLGFSLHTGRATRPSLATQ